MSESGDSEYEIAPEEFEEADNFVDFPETTSNDNAILTSAPTDTQKLTGTETTGIKEESTTDEVVSEKIDRLISDRLGQEPETENAVDATPVGEVPDLPSYTEEELEEIKSQVISLKDLGNSLYRSGHSYGAMAEYTKAIELCRKQLDETRSVLHANRAACHVSCSEYKEAEEDCNSAIELNAKYLKALLRRGQVREKLEKLAPALEDYKSVLELDPRNGPALEAARRLPREIEVQQEKMKEECVEKLKDLGNLVLKPFGLSTDNFKMVQNPETGGYNIQFDQNR
eukprot:sb/3467772/